MKKGKELHLVLKARWFDAHLEEKEDDYRDITPYWCNKLLLYRGVKMPVQFWRGICAANGDKMYLFIRACIKAKVYSFVAPEVVVFSHGMTAMADLRRFEKEFLGIEIGKGRKSWGAKEGVYYFIVKCGDVIAHQNC